MVVKTKLVYEYPDPSDGTRVLVTQYWPRGVSRGSVDEYVRNLAPSRELLRAYRNGELDWARYRHQFLLEMKREASLREIHRLSKIARDGTITILCVCKYEDKCHRSLVRDLIVAFDEE